jgi:site-specific DNA-methyltransferase (adenine-specific)
MSSARAGHAARDVDHRARRGGGAVVIRVGDCLETLRTLADCSVDAVVTDPPYGLGKEPKARDVLRAWLDGEEFKPGGAGFMGKSWDAFVPSPLVWAECLRVLKPGGHLVAFAGSRTYDWIVMGVRLAGFEVRDQLIWMYGSGFPKSHNLKGDWEGYGTALKPAHEPIVLARKPLSGTVAANVLEHGTGAINVDGCRIDALDKTPAPVGVYGRPSIGTTGHTGERNGSADSLGRWPANIIHDGSPEVLAVFPETGSATNHVRGDGSSMGFGGGRGSLSISNGHNDTGSAARFYYSAKASRAERELGLADFAPATVGDGRQTANDTAYQRGKTERRNVHPTVKPVAVMRWLTRLVTPPGGVVLDPYTGSGTTGVAAALEGFEFIGCELSLEYVKIARARIAHAREFAAMWEPDYQAPEDTPRDQLDLFGEPNA